MHRRLVNIACPLDSLQYIIRRSAFLELCEPHHSLAVESRHYRFFASLFVCQPKFQLVYLERVTQPICQYRETLC